MADRINQLEYKLAEVEKERDDARAMAKHNCAEADRRAADAFTSNKDKDTLIRTLVDALKIIDECNDRVSLCGRADVMEALDAARKAGVK